jgi:hypothetical protein
MEVFLLVAAVLAADPYVAEPKKYYPELHDIYRLPPHATAVQQTDIAKRHRAWLDSKEKEIQFDWDQKCRLKACQAEAYALWDLWDDIRIATSPNPDVSDGTRLYMLEKIYHRLGDNWWGGKLPPPVPVWRFRTEE